MFLFTVNILTNELFWKIKNISVDNIYIWKFFISNTETKKWDEEYVPRNWTNGTDVADWLKTID